MTWAVPRHVHLEWRDWDSTSVVYNTASGNTHMLNAVSSCVLKRLEERPASFDDVVSLLGDGGDERDADARTEALLTELDELGLIAPVFREDR